MILTGLSRLMMTSAKPRAVLTEPPTNCSPEVILTSKCPNCSPVKLQFVASSNREAFFFSGPLGILVRSDHRPPKLGRKSPTAGQPEVVRVFLLWLFCIGLVWAQDEPTFTLNVQLVARHSDWSAGLPGEPELRVKGKTRNWSYLDQFRRCLFMVIEAGGWLPADDQAGWERSAGVVVSSLAEGKPVELTVQTLHGRPGCQLKAGEVQAEVVRLEDGRHLLLAVVPFSSQKPPASEFFAGLEVPARFQGQLVSPAESNWSIVFPAAPSGPPEDLQLQQGSSSYRLRQGGPLNSLPREEQLAAIKAEVQAQGQLVGQRSYPVEGLAMEQYTVRTAQGGDIHHRVLWLKPDRLLWLSASQVDSATAQRFFTTFRLWR